MKNILVLSDIHANLLKKAYQIIAEVFGVECSQIKYVGTMKTGMTNCSFVFEINDNKYIIRIPGIGTDKLINRRQEAEVCRVVKDLDICESIVYINPENGIKITKFINGAKCCNPFNPDETSRCMKMLRLFHNLNLHANHSFDIFGQIDFYESLWCGKTSRYNDYQKTKGNVFRLKNYIDKNKSNFTLAHIDAVPDNFLFAEDKIYLIDWEYSAMQDPHIDIAMFCIYSMYEKQDVDRIIDEYFDGKCDMKTRVKIYCYIASCGLLWSNWCEYKSSLGVTFGEYELRQYRYAKDYYEIAAGLVDGAE